MLETLDLSRELPKARYKQDLQRLQRRLHRLQRACWEGKVATLVVFEGWAAAEKGTAISKLTRYLEPRGFSIHSIREPRTYEEHPPWMWRYWVKLPNWGEMAIFDRSWYRRVLAERVDERVAEPEWRKGFRDIVAFERMLAKDRHLIAKFFLHLSKKEQKERFRKRESDLLTAWQVEPKDWAQHKKYDQYLVAAEEMLERTDSEWGPWTLIEATDGRWARIKIFETLIQHMEAGLERHGLAVPENQENDGTAQDPKTEAGGS